MFVFVGHYSYQYLFFNTCVSKRRDIVNLIYVEVVVFNVEEILGLLVQMC